MIDQEKNLQRWKKTSRRHLIHFIVVLLMLLGCLILAIADDNEPPLVFCAVGFTWVILLMTLFGFVESRSRLLITTFWSIAGVSFASLFFIYQEEVQLYQINRLSGEIVQQEHGLALHLPFVHQVVAPSPVRMYIEWLEEDGKVSVTPTTIVRDYPMILTHALRRAG